MTAAPPLREAAVEAAIANAAARRMIAACIRQARSVKELAAQADVPLASAYRQVHGLLESGVLVVERSAMTADGKAYDLYRARVEAARIELRAEHVAVTWSLNRPVEDRITDMWGMLRGPADGH